MQVMAHMPYFGQPCWKYAVHDTYWYTADYSIVYVCAKIGHAPVLLKRF